jgi:hypothetical protein
MRIEQRDGRREEAFLVASGFGAAVSAVAQVSEVAQQGRRGRGTSRLNDLVIPFRLCCAAHRVSLAWTDMALLPL